MGSIKDFSDNASLQKVADNYFQGDTSEMLTERANYHNTQAAAALTKLNELGYSPERAGRYIGEINALNTIAQSKFYEGHGDQGVLTSEGGRLEDQLAKYQTLQSAAMATGKMKGPDDMAGFNRFLRDHHGVDVKYVDNDGINTTNVTSDGKTVYSEMRGAWNLTTADKKGNPAHDTLVKDIKKQNPNFEAIDGATFHVAWRGGRYETLSTEHSMFGGVSQWNGYNETNFRNLNQSGTSNIGGTNYAFGNDVLTAMMDGNSKIISSNYREAFVGQVPNSYGRALVDHTVHALGGYGTMVQAIQDSFTANASGGVDLSHSLLGKVLGLSAGMSLTGQRRAVEELSANALNLSMQSFYRDIMQQNMTAEWKAQQFTNLGKELYGLMERNGSMSTGEQMLRGADNPLKGQGVTDKTNKQEELNQWDNIVGP
jgi:hypothetical protein